MLSRLALSSLLALAALAGACAKGTEDVSDNGSQMTPIDTTCVPDEIVYCPCATGGAGERQCRPDGSGFDACQCTEEGDTLPAGWICTPDRYGDGACDCDCGAPDPECFPGACTAGSGGAGSGGAGSGGAGSGGAGGTPSGGPAGWTCDPSWYGDGQFCDCNCGLADPDCSATQCSSGSSSACTHSACTAGGALGKWCSPCSLAVCTIDSYCCSTSWDAQCVLQAQLLCSC